MSPIPCLLHSAQIFHLDLSRFVFQSPGFFLNLFDSDFRFLFPPKISLDCLLHSVVLAFLYLPALCGMLMVYECVIKYLKRVSGISSPDNKRKSVHVVLFREEWPQSIGVSESVTGWDGEMVVSPSDGGEMEFALTNLPERFIFKYFTLTNLPERDPSGSFINISLWKFSHCQFWSQSFLM